MIIGWLGEVRRVVSLQNMVFINTGTMENTISPPLVPVWVNDMNPQRCCGIWYGYYMS